MSRDLEGLLSLLLLGGIGIIAADELGITNFGFFGGGGCGKSIYQSIGSGPKFKDWGRSTTNLASGGSEPSRRWDADVPLSWDAVEATATFNVGTPKGNDAAGFKLRGPHHQNGQGGWYGVGVKFDGSPFLEKEYPHPHTTEQKCQGPCINVGNIRNTQVTLKAVIWNEGNTPRIQAFVKRGGGNMVKTVDAKDTGQMKPGPVLTKPVMKGSGLQDIQLRIDKAPNVKVSCVSVRRIKPPGNLSSIFADKAKPATKSKSKSKKSNLGELYPEINSFAGEYFGQPEGVVYV